APAGVGAAPRAGRDLRADAEHRVRGRPGPDVRRCRGRVMHEPSLDAELLHVFERVPSDASGALVREQSDGTMAGALLVEHGRVCWAMRRRYPRRLTDILADEQNTLSPAQLDEVFAMCRRERRPLGETLIERGMVSLPILHRALLRHTCEAL